MPTAFALSVPRVDGPVPVPTWTGPVAIITSRDGPNDTLIYETYDRAMFVRLKDELEAAKRRYRVIDAPTA